jgi:hypothetical protein
MASKLATLGGAALATLMVLSFPTPADARWGGGGGHGFHMGGAGLRMGGPSMGGPRMFGPRAFGPRMFGPRHFVGPRPFFRRAHFARVAHFQHRPFFHRRFFHRRFHRNVFFVSPFFAAYPYSYNYGYSCYWLRRNAAYTGSPYWWNRYRACLYGYGY